MGTASAASMDAWLRAGGAVVASSDRAARAVGAAYHRARRAEGLTAWTAPSIHTWAGFVRSAWEDLAPDARLVLNRAQEQSLWARIIEQSGHTAGWLPRARFRLAATAMEAQELLCNYAPQLLRASVRANWPGDSAVFSAWLEQFDEACRTQELLSPSRIPLELVSQLENQPAPRSPLLLAGFDRLLPVQRHIFDLWSQCRELPMDPPSADLAFFTAPDEHAERIACARWCRDQLARNPQTRLLIITQDAGQHRGELERAFLQHSGADFEFSLGVPLNRLGLIRAANLLLRWLDPSDRNHALPNHRLEEQELDWLLASGYATAGPEETAALQAHMRALRRRGQQRARWALAAFLARVISTPGEPSAAARLWADRLARTQRHLAQDAITPQTPVFWAELAPQLLQQAAWPGPRPLTSAEFQARERFRHALDLCASLGFDGRRIPWLEFLFDLERILDETLYAPESQDSAILIAGPAESAGLSADAIWFLDAGEDAWPAPGALNPLLPTAVQRESRMPHASAQLDWDLAESVTKRLIASAPRVRFSSARLKEGVETRPSRIVSQVAGAPLPLPSELTPPLAPLPVTQTCIDTAAIPVGGAQTGLPVEVPGGSSVLTAQSQCPFKAFAVARLGAQSWEPAQAGLTPAQRGQLLHAVLHSVWGQTGIRTLAELNAIPDLHAFVAGHVDRVFAGRLVAALREQMPERYLELEVVRLTRLVADWLTLERTRLPFTVSDTEQETTVTLGGLTFTLRLDRVDTLPNGSQLVIDYKTGDVSLRSWDLPRPDDVQLPLYAGFALGQQSLGGLVFAKVRPGQHSFEGRVVDPTATLIPSLRATSSLAKNPLTPEHLAAWKEAIEQLARDFLAGRADVDPREYPKTCERCGLYTLCRVQERTDEFISEDALDPEALYE